MLAVVEEVGGLLGGVVDGDGYGAGLERRHDEGGLED